MIPDYLRKIKSFLRINRQDLYIAAVIFLVGLASFGLGRLSIIWPRKEPLVIEEPSIRDFLSKEAVDPSLGRQGATVISSQGKYIASKNGTAYHHPWCPGAQKIKEGNKKKSSYSRIILLVLESFINAENKGFESIIKFMQETSL